MSVFINKYYNICQNLSKRDLVALKKCLQNYVNYVMQAKFNLKHMSNVYMR